MPDFSFKCPACKTELTAQDDWRGLQTQCPQCGESVTIPDANDFNKAVFRKFISKTSSQIKKFLNLNKTVIIVIILCIFTLVSNTLITIYFSSKTKKSPVNTITVNTAKENKTPQAKPIYELINAYFNSCLRGNYSVSPFFAPGIQTRIYHNNLINWQIIGNRYDKWNDDSNFIRVIIEICNPHGGSIKRHADFLVKQYNNQWKIVSIQEF